MCTQYDELVAPGGIEAIASALNPDVGAPSNCPATADALDNFLLTGRRVPVPIALSDTYDITANWQTPMIRRRGRQPVRGGWQQAVAELQRLGHCHHFVVWGRRSINTPRRDNRGRHLHRISYPDQDGHVQYVTPSHYFLLVNIRGTIYVADAYSSPPVLATNIQQYIVADNELSSVQYATAYAATPSPVQ